MKQYLVWGKEKGDSVKVGGQVVTGKHKAQMLKKKLEKDKKLKNWIFYIREYR